MALAFDASFYLSTYPDVAAAISRGTIQSAEQHYNDFGRFESRNPNAFFNTAFYLAQYPDVAAARVNPFAHFLANGASEGRLTNATEKSIVDLNGNGSATDDFNETAYRAAYSDVDTAIKSGALKSAYQHFVTFGQFEGRTATLSNGTTVTGPIGNTGAGGSSLSLTTGVDNIVGTANNDVITADNTGASPTLTAADTINGGPGNDTLRVFLPNSASTIPAASISNVESLYVNGGALRSLDATKLTGLTAVTLDSTVQSEDAANVVSISGQTVTLMNQSLSAEKGGAFTTRIASSADTSANVVLNNVVSKVGAGGGTQALDFAGSKIATVNLTSTGSANAVTLTNSASGAPVTTINISGDKALTLTENLANVKTINASSATANVSVDTSAGTANVALTFTGGAGNDKIIFGSSALTKTTVLDGGAGTDTLVIKDTAISSSTTDLNTAINGAKNFEVLGFAGTAVSADLSKITAISQFSIENAVVGADNAAGVAFSGESNTQTVIFNANVTGGATTTAGAGQAGFSLAPSLDNGSNVANLTLNGVTISGGAGGATNSTNASANTSGGVAANLAAFETVNIVSNASSSGAGSNTFAGGNSGAASAGTALVVGANATINVTGAADINLGSIVSNLGQMTNNSITLNASALTGKLTAATGAGNDVITVGSGGSVVFGGAGTDKITFGSGVDVATFTSGTTESGVLASSVVGQIDSISNFRAGAGGDHLAVIGTSADNAFTALTATQLTSVSNAATLTAAANAAADAHSVTGWTAFSYAGNVYALHEAQTTATGYAAGDQLVQLTGVTVTDLTAANFGPVNFGQLA